MKKKVWILFIGWLLGSCAMEGSGGDGGDISSGKGGSMARFAIKGDVLYTVSSDSLKVFNIEDPANPRYYEQRNIKAGINIETVFPMDTLLFMGSRNGMYVYDISEPRFPLLLSQVSHLRSCDPVVAQGNYAYVTLNTNFSSCGGVANNVLDIYDISDISVPILKNTLSLNGPKGLGIDGAKLFVCDKGLKLFDITDPIYPRQVDDLVEIEEVDVREAYDVIPLDGLLILVAKEGLFQFDYTGDRIKYVSKIEIMQ